MNPHKKSPPQGPHTLKKETEILVDKRNCSGEHKKNAQLWM